MLDPSGIAVPPLSLLSDGHRVDATPSFFHNGVFHDLRETIEFYVARDLQRSDGTGVAKAPNDGLPVRCRGNINRDPPFDRSPGDAPARTI
jgi:cytochrome c peroxidase